MNGAYSASKFALEGLSESLRLELAVLGVRVSVVGPGPVATDALARSIREVDVAEGPFAARCAALVRRMRSDGERSSVKPTHMAQAVAQALEDPSPHYRVGGLAARVPRLEG